MRALVLAAGKGTRLAHLTHACPKPMLPVGNRPLLVHLVTWLRDHGISQIAINLHHAADRITSYFGDGHSFGVEITYSPEPHLLGTAGAAKQLAPFFDQPFVVIYGDVYTNLNLTRVLGEHIAAHRRTGAMLTLTLYRVANPTECGLVEQDHSGRVLRFVEKPAPDQVFSELANAGIVVCEPEVLNYVPAGVEFDFGRDLLPALLADDRPVFGTPIAPAEFVIDIGTPEGYVRAQRQATLIGSPAGP